MKIIVNYKILCCNFRHWKFNRSLCTSTW